MNERLRIITITDQGVEVVQVEKDGWDWLHRVMKVGMVEVVSLCDDAGVEVGTMWVDEEGKFNGQYANPVATRVARHFGAIYADDSIAGPVAITGGCDDEGETLELPEAVMLTCMQAITDHAGTVEPIRVAP